MESNEIMSKLYLLEIQKWLRLFDHASVSTGLPLSHNAAIDLRRRSMTSPVLRPDRVLLEMVEFGLIDEIIANGVKGLALSEKAKKWVDEMDNDPDYRLLNAHKHDLANKFLEKWLTIPELVELFSRFKFQNGHYIVSDQEFSLPLELNLIKSLLKTLGVVYFDQGFYFLDSSFDFILKKKILRASALTEKKLLEELEQLRQIGEEGEEWVLQDERRRISQTSKVGQFTVERVSEKNVRLGYDIESISQSPFEERCIEVKTTRSNSPRFYLTTNELRVAKALKAKYWLYVLIGKKQGNEPEKVYRIQDPVSYFTENNVKLYPCLYEVALDISEEMPAGE